MPALARRTLARVALSTLVAMGVLVPGACSGTTPDPAVARREQVETRLRQTFSTAQAACIIGRADDATLVALDRTTALPPASPELRRFSAAMVDCVQGPDVTPEPPPGG